MQVMTQQHDTVDALVWRHTGRTQGMVEAVLALNPGLADHGPVLPPGLQVELPDAPVAPPALHLIQLWD
ncbi:tail protein X [Laribacter hongkongensis]|nr:tail protein X [Laribacter hongkongensis]MCG9031432.1 tail protein X [Laribacter hongkongensis]MCG9091652.1 tail protein X [Laribacter hongkongensis]